MIAEKRGYTANLALLTQFPLMQRAMALGSKPWNRSKVMLVGEGRAGKTALCNSMLGKPFVETESTVGLTQLTCEVQRAAADGNRRWTEHTKPDREYVAGVAQLIRTLESLEPTEKELSHRANNVDSSKLSHHENNARRINSGEQYNADTNTPGSMHESPSEHTRSPAVNNNISSFKSDVSSVMNYLAEVKVHDADLILSLFDFGGQSVFNIIHHLFLTSYGVYVVVFNMVDILDENKREQSLNEILFWINSIIMHTCNTKTFLVGTHKDDVNDNKNFDRISEIIEQRFQYHVGWSHIEEYKNTAANQLLCFFPVNNRVGLLDDVVVDLMSAIEKVVRESDYAKEPRPLTWLRAIDELVDTKKSFLPLDQASSIALANGVEQDAVALFLSFLNEMGVVLWLDEEGLRDVVILDIITFFIEPATLIICNHISNPSDNTIHHKNVQEMCRKNRRKEWDEMTLKGLVSQQLMESLLSHKVDVIIPVVVQMMLKYGLIVRFDTKDRSSQVDEIPANLPIEYYLVPALLPATPDDLTIFQHNNGRNFKSCYFFFTTDAKLLASEWYKITILRNEGFLPRGLMERLICKAVKWIQLTDICANPRLHKNFAALSYRSQEFRLVCLPRMNCIRLDIEGEHPLPVYSRIYELIDKSIKESMGSLKFIGALSLGTKSESEDGFTLLNLEFLRRNFENDCLRIQGHPTMYRQEVKRNFGSWFISTDVLPSYDVFISHRWHKEDDVVAEHLNLALRDITIGSQHRAVQVFFDKARLKDGQQFQEAFGKALVNSTIFVPMVCASALQKMLSHNSADEDNVLIEWMLALECMKDSHNSKLRFIYPVIFKEKKSDWSVGDLFADGIIDRLPEIIPTASIEIVRKLLVEIGVTISSSLATRTVRGIVKEIAKYMGLEGWKYPNGFISTASDAIANQLKASNIN